MSYNKESETGNNNMEPQHYAMVPPQVRSVSAGDISVQQVMNSRELPIFNGEIPMQHGGNIRRRLVSHEQILVKQNEGVQFRQPMPVLLNNKEYLQTIEMLDPHHQIQLERRRLQEEISKPPPPLIGELKRPPRFNIESFKQERERYIIHSNLENERIRNAEMFGPNFQNKPMKTIGHPADPNGLKPVPEPRRMMYVPEQEPVFRREPGYLIEQRTIKYPEDQPSNQELSQKVKMLEKIINEKEKRLRDMEVTIKKLAAEKAATASSQEKSGKKNYKDEQSKPQSNKEQRLKPHPNNSDHTRVQPDEKSTADHSNEENVENKPEDMKDISQTSNTKENGSITDIKKACIDKGSREGDNQIISVEKVDKNNNVRDIKKNNEKILENNSTKTTPEDVIATRLSQELPGYNWLQNRYKDENIVVEIASNNPVNSEKNTDEFIKDSIKETANENKETTEDIKILSVVSLRTSETDSVTSDLSTKSKTLVDISSISNISNNDNNNTELVHKSVNDNTKLSSKLLEMLNVNPVSSSTDKEPKIFAEEKQPELKQTSKPENENVFKNETQVEKNPVCKSLSAPVLSKANEIETDQKQRPKSAESKGSSISSSNEDIVSLPTLLSTTESLQNDKEGKNNHKECNLLPTKKHIDDAIGMGDRNIKNIDKERFKEQLLDTTTEPKKSPATITYKPLQKPVTLNRARNDIVISSFDDKNLSPIKAKYDLHGNKVIPIGQTNPIIISEPIMPRGMEKSSAFIRLQKDELKHRDELHPFSPLQKEHSRGGKGENIPTQFGPLEFRSPNAENLKVVQDIHAAQRGIATIPRSPHVRPQILFDQGIEQKLVGPIPDNRVLHSYSPLDQVRKQFTEEVIANSGPNVYLEYPASINNNKISQSGISNLELVQFNNEGQIKQTIPAGRKEQHQIIISREHGLKVCSFYATDFSFSLRMITDCPLTIAFKILTLLVPISKILN